MILLAGEIMENMELDKIAEMVEELKRQGTAGRGGEVADLSGDLMELLALGGTMKAVFDFDDKDMEVIYFSAHGYYENGKYEKAAPLFQFLCVYDHLNPKWFMGLGATLQMMRNYEEAVKSYGYATILDMENPAPQYNAGYCLALTGKKDAARLALEAVVMLADDRGGMDEYRRKAENLLSTLNEGEHA
jgi:type III secretion system low calcium response chaperone LcrH/SycD